MFSPAFLVRAVALVAAAICTTPAFAAGPFAYIANSGSDNVSVIDTSTDTVVATVPVGDNPYGVGITRDWRYVYVANFSSNSLSIIDAKTNTVVHTIENVCANPAFVEPSPNGTEMYVSCFNGQRVNIVNIATNTVTRWIVHQTRPLGITFNADGSRVYIASYGNSTIRVHRTSDLAQIVQAPSGTVPTDVQINPAGTHMWVLSNGESRLSSIDLVTHQMNRTLWLNQGLNSLTIHPAGVMIYITNISSSVVTAYNIATNGSSTINVGGGPSGIDRNADGSRVYVANEGSNSVHVINTATNAIVATIPVGSVPHSWGRFVAKGFPPADNTPGAPTNVIATAGVAQVSVAFTPGSDGGAPIERYTVTCGTQTAIGTASPIVVTNLAVGTPVSCTVVATNNAGDSVASELSNTATPYAIVPAAPTGVVATPGDYAISVAFATPYDGHSPITHYTATCTTPTLTETFSATGTASPLVVPATPNAHVYTCRVVATNAIGDGAASAPSAAVMPNAAPAQPTIETPVRGNGRLTVGFAAGAAPHGHSPITSWKVTCGTQQATGTASPLTVTGLPNGTLQTCTAVATNTRGNSVPSEPSAAVAPATVPDAPTITGVARGNGKVMVSFTPPAFNGGTPIVGYIIQCGAQVVFGGNLLLPVSGLPNGVPVTCTARARNDVGDGPWSAPSASVTPATTPDAPTGAAATRGDAQISVAFVAPANNGGAAISGYTAQCGAQTASGTASPLVVTGLANGTATTCNVWAINDVGNGAHATTNSVTPATVPDAPTGIVATAGDRRVVVAFAAPADDGGSDVTDYVAACGTRSALGAASPITVTGLTNGVAVTCTVYATNDVGNGATSTPSDSVTPATVPDAPTLSAIASGDGSAQLTFDPPAQDGGAAIAGYLAACTPGAHTATGTASPLTVTGLTNGQTYTCSVTATNAVGAGAASTGLSVVPLRVADLSVSIDNDTAFIGGGTETSYLIDVVNGGTSGVTGVRVVDAIGAAFTNASWVCSAQAGSSCPASGNGGIDVAVNLAAQSSVSLLLTATVPAQPEAPVSNTVTITAPVGIDDPVTSNNSATDGPDAVGIFADRFE